MTFAPNWILNSLDSNNMFTRKALRWMCEKPSSVRVKDGRMFIEKGFMMAVLDIQDTAVDYWTPNGNLRFIYAQEHPMPVDTEIAQRHLPILFMAGRNSEDHIITLIGKQTCRSLADWCLKKVLKTESPTPVSPPATVRGYVRQVYDI